MAQPMTPEMLEGTPAGTPPPGLIPNSTNPGSNGPTLIAVGSVLIALMVLSVGIRVYSKIKIVGKSSPDDCKYASRSQKEEVR